MKKIYKLIIGLWGLETALLLLLCIPNTANNLPGGKVFFVLVLWMTAATFLLLAGIRLKDWLERYHKVLFPGFLILYGCLLAGLCILNQSEQQGECANLIAGARYVAGLSDRMDWMYFARCNNNIIPMLTISLIFCLGHMLGLENPYGLGVLINILQVLAALYCVFHICRKNTGGSYVAGWLGMVLLAVCFPILGQTKALYTDAMTFCLGIVAFYLWQEADAGEHTGGKYWLRLIGAGILWGVGGALKPTVLISLVAVFLFICFFQKGSRWKNLVMLVPVLLLVMGLGRYADGFSDEELVAEAGTPKFSYWIAIGLKGDGSFCQNEDYSYGLNSVYGMEEKENWTYQYIRKNLYEFINPEHIKNKAINNFANGCLGGSDFMYAGDEQDILFDWVSQEGKFFWYYSMICTGYFYFLLVLMIFSCVQIWKNKDDICPGIFVPMITMLGIMIYLMIFEANNRQLYNHMPWLVCVSVNGLVFAVEAFIHKRSLNNRENRTKIAVNSPV